MLPACKKFAFVPIAFALYTGAGFFVCLGILKSRNEDVRAKRKWPYISDTGTSPPQSCVFTLVMTTSAFFLFIIAHIHYCYVKRMIGMTKVNTASWYIAVVVSLSMIITGSFQYTNSEVVHFIGAFGVFLFLGVYCVLVTVTSVAIMKEKIYPKWIVVLRITITVIANISQVSFAILIIIWFLNRTATVVMMFSSIAEWSLIYAGIIYASTMSYDFAKIASFRSEINLVVGSPTPHVDAAVNNEAYVETEKNDQEQTDV